MTDCKTSGHIWDGRPGRDFSCEKCGTPYSPPQTLTGSAAAPAPAVGDDYASDPRSIPGGLRWLAEQSDRPNYMPSGDLTGKFLIETADAFVRQVHENRSLTTQLAQAQAQVAEARKAPKQVVAWLRGCERTSLEPGVYYAGQRAAYKFAADCIERGDYASATLDSLKPEGADHG